MLDTVKTEPIPTPPKKAIVGNMLSIDKDTPLQSLMDLTRQYGHIFQLDMMGTPIVMVSDTALVTELCDETRFDKAVRGALRRVRAIGGDGLFTGDTQEANWQKAHNILLPTFSRQAMNNYMPMMLDVATQLVTKWERLNADDEIDVVHDMTAVALDTIGLCGFDYRFNSFYRRDYHPFIEALTRTLEACMMQRGLPFEQHLLRGRLKQMERDVAFMNKLVDDIIRERRRGGDASQNDLLNYMLSGVDKVTGDSLSDENIRYQINTFLIAGHETTSGLMSFTLYFLLNNPDVLEKAYEEVDRVLGRDVSVEPTIKQVNQLTYVQQILFEALRLWPTAPAFSLYPYQDEIIGGKYALKKRTFITVLTLMLHRDKAVWGEDCEAFNPENFSKEAIAGRPIHAYKPFGNGQRACIGRQFAMQEATLVMGMILQRFRLIDPHNYELKIKESLSIKPDGFFIKVRPREGVVRSALVPGGKAPEESRSSSLAEAATRPSHGTPALVLYGSNLGSTEDFAREMARAAEAGGFDANLAPLDDYAAKLPKNGLLVIATASYNGTPPDNAAAFVEWLKSAPEGEGEGVKYAIFGCGHSDWAATFQATPRLIDEHMQRIGAKRIGALGEGDARDDIDDEFQTWLTEMRPLVADEFGIDAGDLAANDEPLYDVEVLTQTTESPLVKQTGARHAEILVNRELQNREGKNASERSTRHIEVDLPDGMAYRPGDHLCVVPVNAPDLVERAAGRFGMSPQTAIRLSASSAEHSQLPTDRPVALAELFGSWLELQSVATRKDVEALANHTQCPKSRPALDGFAGDEYRAEVFLKRRSTLDLLECFPACELSLAAFLEMCPMLAPRYYSISSAPGEDTGRCSITVAVVNEPAISGDGRFKGVCSNYLAGKDEGSGVDVSIRDTKDAFRLPEDPEAPIIMIGPGTGIAPFRGFLQQREIWKREGKTLGPAMLFFGCRHPDQDYLYREELEAWAKEGLVDLACAFSRKGRKKTYVQDLIREKQDEVWKLIEAGAKIFVCGDGSRMEPDVKRTLSLICSEQTDKSAEAAEAWMQDMAARDRYVLDVWVAS